MGQRKDGALRKVAGLILAAGASSRLGTPKQLLSVGDSCLLDIVVGEALNSDLHRVYLVLGFQAERIKAALHVDLQHPKLTIVENSAYEQGMSTSIVAGVSEAQTLYEDIMILLADMPFINRHVINKLLHQYLKSGLPLGAVSIGGKRSHPVIINRIFYKELHALRGDVGARGLFMKSPDRVCLTDVDDVTYGMDIDTMDDYQAYQKHLGKESVEE